MELFKAVLGSAGVGKSWAVNEKLKEDSKYFYRTATTGVAAINMSSTIAGNTPNTINATLGYYNSESLLYKYVSGDIDKNLSRIAKYYKYLMIDEASMLEAAQLDIICMAIERYNKKNNTNLGLYITGDSGQLPAVTGQPFFEAKTWNKFDITYLTEVKRQKDKEFIEALSQVRKGNAADVVDWFFNNVEHDKIIDPNFEGSTFFSKNSEVDFYNKTTLNKIPNKSVIYKSTLLGQAAAVWKDVPEYVELKKGALVQIMVNSLSEGYANGDMGFVEELYPNTVVVRLIRNGRVIHIKHHNLENKPLGSFKSIGTLRRMPLRLAYSITSHRAQGLTIDAAQIKVGDDFISRSSGMLYVMLSRVRSKEGLRIVGTKDQFIKSCFIDPRYKKWV